MDNAKYTPVLTVDGIQFDLYNAANETFTGDVVLTLVEKGDSNANQGAPFGADKAQSKFGPFYYTAAAYIADGQYDAAKSAEAAVQQGSVTNTSADGLTVDSEGDYFSGLYINNSDYAINDANMTFTGAGGDDFNGWGAGVVVLGSSHVEINRSVILSEGVLRSAVSKRVISISALAYGSKNRTPTAATAAKSRTIPAQAATRRLFLTWMLTRPMISPFRFPLSGKPRQNHLDVSASFAEFFLKRP